MALLPAAARRPRRPALHDRHQRDRACRRCSGRSRRRRRLRRVAAAVAVPRTVGSSSHRSRSGPARCRRERGARAGHRRSAPTPRSATSPCSAEPSRCRPGHAGPVRRPAPVRSRPGAWRPCSARPAAPAGGWRTHHLAARLVGLVALEVSAIAMVAPGVLLVWWVLLTLGVLAGLPPPCPPAPVFVLTVCVVVAAGKRPGLPRTPAACISSAPGSACASGSPTRSWSSACASPTPCTRRSTRCRGCGCSARRSAAVPRSPPPRTSTRTSSSSEQESFVADMASVGAATFADGHFAIGDPPRSGAGLSSATPPFVPTGTSAGARLARRRAAPCPRRRTSPTGRRGWAHRAIHLPVRQAAGPFAEDVTFRPVRDALVRHRLAIEFFRATLPATLLGISSTCTCWPCRGSPTGATCPSRRSSPRWSPPSPGLR